MAVGNGILGVGVESYEAFKGTFFLLESKNDQIAYEQFDHIVEGSLKVQSRVLQLLDCPNLNIELKIAIHPGKHRARIYSSYLVSVVEDDGDDYYKIELWPDDDLKRSVLKQYGS